ncbi:unnamed protein product [Lepidochelys olivacea]
MKRLEEEAEEKREAKCLELERAKLGQAGSLNSPPPGPFYSREVKVLQFTSQERDDAEWPEGVYYERKSNGGVEEVSPSITLGHKQRQQTRDLCVSFTTTFSATPGRTERECHSSDTGDAHPIRAQPYRMAPQAKITIEREIKDMLQMGVIRPSESAWASPVVLVPKADGEICFCVDCRKLNAVTRPKNYPIPRTDELPEKLGRAQFISTLNLTKGYWQVPLDESAKERSAFTTHVGLYELNVLPYGLRYAPTTFQRPVNNLLAGFGEFAVACLDNVAIFSDSWEEHLEHLQAVFQCIREAGLMVKAKKCQIGLNRVTYLGHQVSQGTINPLQAKYASEHGVGAVLMQEGPDQEFHPVVFLSKIFPRGKATGQSVKKNVNAIVYALEKLCP